MSADISKINKKNGSTHTHRHYSETICYLSLSVVAHEEPCSNYVANLNLRRSRDGAFVRASLRAFVHSCATRFTLARFYADCPHKRII